MDITFKNSGKLQDEYQSKCSLYGRFCFEITKQLVRLLEQYQIATAVPIHFRVKKFDSICQKSERYKTNFSSLDEVGDLAGVRIVLLFKRDIKKVCKVIEHTFKVIRKEDTHQRLGDNQFGYGSIHYDLKPPSSWFSLPTLSGLQGLRFELQVRTASQHIWAEVSHMLQYKQENDVPIPLRRSINRVAALLETVDDDFDHVLNERESYVKKIEKTAESRVLNTDLLRKTLERILPKQNYKVNDEPFAELLEELRFFKIDTVKSLESLISKNWDKVKKVEDDYVARKKKDLEDGKKIIGTSEERIRKGVYFCYVGLTRQTLAVEFGKAFDDFRASKRRNI